MRKALRALAVAALVAGLVAAVSGSRVLRLLEGAMDESPGETHSGAAGITHAVAGHLAVVLACVVASMAFVLGLQGLLEAGGRKASSTLLFILGPAVMALALAAEFSGHIDHDAASAGFLAGELAVIGKEHALVVAPALGLSLLATAAVAGWLLWQRSPK